MKSILAYLLFVGIVLQGAHLGLRGAYPEAFKPAVAKADVPPAPRIVAKTDAANEPFVDPKDPDLFDARGKFPSAMREAMARAKRESIRDFASVRADNIKAAKEKKAREKRLVRRPTKPRPSIDAAESYAQIHQPFHERLPRQSPAWNTGGFGFGF